MNSRLISQRVNSDPSPFVFRLSDGTRVPVEHPDFVAVSPGQVVVDNGVVSILLTFVVVPRSTIPVRKGDQPPRRQERDEGAREARSSWSSGLRGSTRLSVSQFAGLSPGNRQAQALGLSLRATERLWTFARTWLHRQLSRPD
jgi:hypothetical protein